MTLHHLVWDSGTKTVTQVPLTEEEIAEYNLNVTAKIIINATIVLMEYA